MRVLFISIATVIVLFIVLTITRLWGMGQQFADFQHPFFTEKDQPMAIFKVTSEKELNDILKEKADAVFWIDVETTNDKKVVTFAREFSSSDMSVDAYRGPKSLAYEFQKIQNMHPDVRELKDVIANYPEQRFVINVTDNTENVHKWITESLKGLSGEKRILLQSNYNVIMTSIKDIEPFWLFGCSQADLMRFMTFDSMWILPSIQFKGDVYIAPFKIMGRDSFNESILEEVRRRHKKIVLGPLKNKTEYDDALRLKADGLVFEKWTDFLAWTRP